MKIIFHRVLHFTLAIVLMISLLPMNIFTVTVSAVNYATGDSITFGSYPQDKVTDSSLISALNTCTLDANNSVTYGGNKYKYVKFTQYTPYYSTLAPSADKSYQDDNGYYTDTTYWFKYMPIRWRVLSNTNGVLFLMAEKIMDSRAYNLTYTGTTWESSTLRTWLNNDFYSMAFSSDEKGKIETSTVVNDDHPLYNIEGGNNTNDKLFLLSYNEAINPTYGFNSSYKTADTARKAQGTDFSKCNGLYVYPSSPCTGNSGWWFRSPGNSASNASQGNGYGHIYDFYTVNKAYVGVRPVMNLNTNTPSISPVEGSGCVINNETKFIYGLEKGLLKTRFETYFIRLSGNVKLVYNTISDDLGTGTKVDLVNKSTDAVFSTYYIVIFGDVNGDGNIDASDADVCVNVQNWKVSWDHDAQEYFYKAGDLNGDGNVDLIDADIIVEVQNWKMNINQVTGLAIQN